jgi:hypothetical protein
MNELTLLGGIGTINNVEICCDGVGRFSHNVFPEDVGTGLVVSFKGRLRFH